MEPGFCVPEKRPCTPKDTILTPGFGYSITPVPKFSDRPGRENRVHFCLESDLQVVDFSMKGENCTRLKFGQRSDSDIVVPTAASEIFILGVAR